MLSVFSIYILVVLTAFTIPFHGFQISNTFFFENEEDKSTLYMDKSTLWFSYSPFRPVFVLAGA